MIAIGKLLMIAGLILLAVGAAVWGLGRVGFRGLPGDIRYEGENVRFYFPVVTGIVLSIVVTAIIWLWQWFMRR